MISTVQRIVACVSATTVCITLFALAGPAVAGPRAGTDARAIVRTAKSVLGSPYSYGGTSPSGFDCSGLTMWVYGAHGIALPHSSLAQYELAGTRGFRRIGKMNDLKPGDLVFHDTTGATVGHVGIYLGDGRFISATSSEGVRVRSLRDSYWGPRWVGATRIIPSHEKTAARVSMQPDALKRLVGLQNRQVALDLVRRHVGLVVVPLLALVAQ